MAPVPPMTPAPPVTLPEALEAVRTLLGGQPADEVVCEITRHGTMRLTAKAETSD